MLANILKLSEYFPNLDIILTLINLIEKSQIHELDLYFGGDTIDWSADAKDAAVKYKIRQLYVKVYVCAGASSHDRRKIR